jgi:hypothetical protein
MDPITTRDLQNAQSPFYRTTNVPTVFCTSARRTVTTPSVPTVLGVYDGLVADELPEVNVCAAQ